MRSSRLAKRIEFALLPVRNNREGTLFKKRDGYSTAQCTRASGDQRDLGRESLAHRVLKLAHHATLIRH